MTDISWTKRDSDSHASLSPPSLVFAVGSMDGTVLFVDLGEGRGDNFSISRTLFRAKLCYVWQARKDGGRLEERNGKRDGDGERVGNIESIDVLFHNQKPAK